jgi:RNA ligase
VIILKQILLKRQFPYIETINDLRLGDGSYPWEKYKEIKLLKKEVNGKKVYIVHYMVAFKETFDEQINRECRGIMFNEKGEVISRPFHKFFNINEREETYERNLEDRKFMVLEKIDGALIIPELINDKIFFRTKKSFESEEAKLVYEYLQKFDKKDREEFLEINRKLIEQGFTPLYEFVWTERYPHVVSYSEPKLYFLAVRDIYTGRYFLPDENWISEPISNLPMNYGIEMSLEEVKELLRNKPKNFEGYTLIDIYDFYKIKTEWYLNLHKTLELIQASPKYIVKLILKEELDDLKSLLTTQGLTNHVKRIEEVEYLFWKEYEKVQNIVDYYWDKLKEMGRKDIFIFINSQLKQELQEKVYDLVRFYLISRYNNKTDKEKEIKLWQKYFKTK